jgi:hypothetical protein
VPFFFRTVNLHGFVPVCGTSAAHLVGPVVDRCGISAARLVEPCGNHRWTLRRFLRHPSWELAATIVGKIVEACGIFAATVVGASLTNR